MHGRNAFYTRKCEQAGIRIESLRFPEDVDKLPFTTKAELTADQEAHPPYGSDLTYPLDRYVRLHQTSGTAGRPLRILDTRASWAWWTDIWTLVYSAGQRLVPGLDLRTIDLRGTLARLGYVEARERPSAPGQFRATRAAWEIYLHGGVGAGAPGLLRITLDGDRIRRLTRGGLAVERAALEPEVLTTIAHRPGEEHRPVHLDEVPQALVDAVLAAEDHRFFEHGGLDSRGLLRAAWANLRAGRIVQGGSTITQQLIENRLLGARRTVTRKLGEAWLARVIESRYPKAQILEAYLNEVYLGQRGGLAIRGVGAAARAFFHKEVHQLTLSEAAVLAGMIRAPNSHSPVLNPGRARHRRDVVLARMYGLGKLDAATYERARREPHHREHVRIDRGQRAERGGRDRERRHEIRGDDARRHAMEVREEVDRPREGQHAPARTRPAWHARERRHPRVGCQALARGPRSLDHAIRPEQERGRHGDAENLRRVPASREWCAGRVLRVMRVVGCSMLIELYEEEWRARTTSDATR